MTDWKTTMLGKTGWKVGRLGLASSYGADERCVQMAFERGVNYLYWGSMRTAKFGEGLRSLRSRRDEFRLVIQSYSRIASKLFDNWQDGRAGKISSHAIYYSSTMPKSACISAPHSLSISICLPIFRGVPWGTDELAASKG